MPNITIIKKNIKHIYIKITPKGVILSVPLRVSNFQINSILEKRKEWISKKLELYKNSPQEKKFIDGENIEYLGKNYYLKVIESSNEFAQIQKNYFYIYTKKKDNLDKKKQLLQNWYKQQAKICFQTLIDEYLKLLNLEIKQLKIRQMKTRWGSCNHYKKYINLNLELIKKPISSIEYVVLHELAHLIYPNHSKDFYDYIATYMPDWKQRKKRLNNI